MKATSPKIYKDQLVGAKQIIAAHLVNYGAINADLLARILTAPRLTATQFRALLDAYQLNPERVSAARVGHNLTLPRQPAPWRIKLSLMAN
ncbi:hypothetical protein GO003_005000 [Methylicorpusculum oleiharenae]|uniref:hypothetical protein n=1 Tax=Methylicorpusculum oleiharenae TaxID=1338687 RepID=UPI001E2E65AB|nr:hypothetical protein [Methylicorpusculum oleiharenae]MCD2449746.1 hypothetical protein [Methylicorpusculum oleiharenae]